MSKNKRKLYAINYEASYVRLDLRSWLLRDF